ncbi:MAG: type II toxin-antitoxin system VapC family toxin [Cyanobacteriota bacterium]
MSSVCLIDTSIFLNLLNVPYCNESNAEVTADFATFVEAGCIFLLPMATILETGNHIAQNGDGNLRRKTAQRFVTAVKGAFSGEAPWRPMVFPVTEEILAWIDTFPDYAGRNKAPDKPEGIGFGDLTIIQEFEKARDRFPMSEVFIWSLDSDLRNYHHIPRAS